MTVSVWLFLFSQFLFSQSTTDKVFFDRTGKASGEAQAYYYRQQGEGTNYKEYYVNGGALYFEGQLTNASVTNESENSYAGTCIWYFRNGKKKATRTFDSDGKENGVSNYFYESGKLWKEIEFEHGKMANNRIKEFDEDGQSSRIFEEEFDNNNNDWDLYESEKSIARIENGQMLMSSLTNEGTTRLINVPIESNNFAIEAVINMKKFRDGEKTGIIFGFKDWQNYNFFFITNNSMYLGTVYEGVSSDKTEGMHIGAVKAKGINNIKVIGAGDKNIYSVNGEIQYTSDKLRLSGSNVGFGVSGKSSIRIEKMIVKEIEFKSSGVSTTNADKSVKAIGTGLIFSTDGYILTNHHVIDNAESIEVEVFNGDVSKSYKATVVQKDADNDLAILKINDAAFIKTDSIPYSFKESGGVDVGTSVFTIGFPYALSGMGKEAKFTDGKISSKTGYNNAINTYQTSIPVQPGNSGGPLFNDKGQLIGVINAKVSAADNVSYAIKLNYVRNLIELLPTTFALPNNQALNSAPLEEKVKAFSKCVVLIKLK